MEYLLLYLKLDVFFFYYQLVCSKDRKNNLILYHFLFSAEFGRCFSKAKTRVHPIWRA